MAAIFAVLVIASGCIIGRSDGKGRWMRAQAPVKNWKSGWELSGAEMRVYQGIMYRGMDS